MQISSLILCNFLLDMLNICCELGYFGFMQRGLQKYFINIANIGNLCEIHTAVCILHNSPIRSMFMLAIGPTYFADVALTNRNARKHYCLANVIFKIGKIHLLFAHYILEKISHGQIFLRNLAKNL